MEFVDLHAQYLSIKDEIDQAIAGVIAESDFILGPRVAAFEEAFAQAVQAPYCVSCANGTDAIYIALKALGVQPGDEVIVPAHTWIATSETVSQAGGTVVFADTDDAFGMDPDDLARKITPRTKGVIAVHFTGQPCAIDRIAEITRANGLFLIEDSAQAHLATFDGKPIGTWGDVTTYSFYPGKNLGAMGDAGALTTAREDVAEFARLFARHGGKGQHIMEGINSRLDTLQAAILNVKLPHLPGWTEARQRLANRYDELLADIPEVVRPVRRPNAEGVFHLYIVQVPHRDALREHLRQEGIPTILSYSTALPFLPAYAAWGHTPADFPMAARHQDTIVSLPIYPELTDAQQEQVAGAIRAFFRSMPS